VETPFRIRERMVLNGIVALGMRESDFFFSLKEVI